MHIVISEEAATYRPEMAWVAENSMRTQASRFNRNFNKFTEGDAAYRFFELFDLANVAYVRRMFELAAEKRNSPTPPPKPLFEEKLLLALLWNRYLRGFWRQELGESFFHLAPSWCRTHG